MKKPELIPNWRDSWRWYSTRAIAALALLPGAWMMLPDQWREAVPDEWKAALCVIVGLAGWLGRIVEQPTKE